MLRRWDIRLIFGALCVTALLLQGCGDKKKKDTKKKAKKPAAGKPAAGKPAADKPAADKPAK